MIDALLLPLAQASARCYTPSARPLFTNDARVVHVFHEIQDGVHVFAFEGTSSIWEWMVDFAAMQVPVIDHPQLGPVHLGFWLDVQSVMPRIKAYLDSLGRPPCRVTGHSKGSGEAILAHADLKADGYNPLPTWVFEPPRVGSKILADYIGDDVGWTRTINWGGPDIVTLVPGTPWWSHLRKCLQLQVVDAYNIEEKHRMPSVLEALANL